ncbi:hypothetical protein BH11VER1_BH11VER1_09550 [soil metagenome]
MHLLNANYTGLFAVVLGLIVFAVTHRKLLVRPVFFRLKALLIFGILALPSVLFATYYLHLLPEREWFYELRSWRGTEFLVVFLGAAAGALASLLPRAVLIVPLFGFMAAAMVPYLKPLMGPLADDDFREKWEGDACLQSTLSTCGPASVSTIMRRLGLPVSEREVARAAFTYTGGTEAWYLARYVRSNGLHARFAFHKSFAPSEELPAVVGVVVGNCGHFIAVLEVNNGQVSFVDPMFGPEKLSLSDFKERFTFTGFRLVIHKP